MTTHAEVVPKAITDQTVNEYWPGWSAGTDANSFGERLRYFCFVPDGDYEQLGCYSTFKLRPGFEPVEMDEQKFAALVGRPFSPADDEHSEWDLWDDLTVMKNARWFHCAEYDVDVAWYWDGDGLLYVRHGSKAARNGDCKHVNEWEWANEL